MISFLKTSRVVTERREQGKREIGVTHPTAENSGASSYSVKEMFFLCSAIASARPAMPAPGMSVRGCRMRALDD